jgi:hypothetical protein
MTSDKENFLAKVIVTGEKTRLSLSGLWFLTIVLFPLRIPTALHFCLSGRVGIISIFLQLVIARSRM